MQYVLFLILQKGRVILMGRRFVRGVIYFILLIGILCGILSIYRYYLSMIPDSINLKACSEQEIDFCVPVSGVIMPETAEEANIPIDFSKEFTMVTGERETYVAFLKLFGIFPYKDVTIHVVEEQMLIPMGKTVGIYVETDGILVIDTGSFVNNMGIECAPAEGYLQKGDYILTINGQHIARKKELIDLIESSEGRPLDVTVRRNGEIMSISMTPVQTQSGEYKLGIWVRDSAQGVGTLTYLDLEGNFGALGHGIADSDTGVLMDMNKGELYRSQVIAIEKGQAGHPGEITGMIHYVHDNIIGTIDCNTSNGVFGTLGQQVMTDLPQPVEVGYRSEVHPGAAQILCDITGELRYYDIRIEHININSTDNKGLTITITDPELLDITGGIVQGMSGSPILQDGKLIGAVTHVLVRDSAKGYGIFIENMLGH